MTLAQAAIRPATANTHKLGGGIQSQPVSPLTIAQATIANAPTHIPRRNPFSIIICSPLANRRGALVGKPPLCFQRILPLSRTIFANPATSIASRNIHCVCDNIQPHPVIPDSAPHTRTAQMLTHSPRKNPSIASISHLMTSGRSIYAAIVALRYTGLGRKSGVAKAECLGITASVPCRAIGSVPGQHLVACPV